MLPHPSLPFSPLDIPDKETNSTGKLKLFWLRVAIITESCKSNCVVASPSSYISVNQGGIYLIPFQNYLIFWDWKKKTSVPTFACIFWLRLFSLLSILVAIKVALLPWFKWLMHFPNLQGWLEELKKEKQSNCAGIIKIALFCSALSTNLQRAEYFVLSSEESIFLFQDQKAFSILTSCCINPMWW